VKADEKKTAIEDRENEYKRKLQWGLKYREIEQDSERWKERRKKERKKV
jgi:hypothetical protein